MSEFDPSGWDLLSGDPASWPSAGQVKAAVRAWAEREGDGWSQLEAEHGEAMVKRAAANDDRIWEAVAEAERRAEAQGERCGCFEPGCEACGLDGRSEADRQMEALGYSLDELDRELMARQFGC
jgi:hypothetical protein